MSEPPRAAVPERNKRLERRLASAEASLRQKTDVEEIRAFTLDGTELPRHTSKRPDAVYISYEVGERYRDAVVTHNHPSEGVGLSHLDIRAAVDYGWAEVRAVDAKRKIYTYALRRPMEGWGTRAAFDNAWRVVSGHVEAAFRYRIATGRMTREQGDFERHHETLKRVAKLLGWSYQRTIGGWNGTNDD
jgi:hypothetical protein